MNRKLHLLRNICRRIWSRLRSFQILAITRTNKGRQVMEISPTDQQKALVDEALFLRGRIIASYSQVEFLLADISVKLDLRFPYRIQDRIKAARRIAEREGYAGYK